MNLRKLKRIGRAIRQGSILAERTELPSKMSAAGRAAFNARVAKHAAELRKAGHAADVSETMGFMMARYPRLAKRGNLGIAKLGDLPPHFMGGVGIAEGGKPISSVGRIWKMRHSTQKGPVELSTKINPAYIRKDVIAHELRHVADFRKFDQRKMARDLINKGLFVPYGFRKEERRAFNTQMRYVPGLGERINQRANQHLADVTGAAGPFGTLRSAVIYGGGGATGKAIYDRRKRKKEERG